MKALQPLNIEGFISKKRQILLILLIAVSTSVSADFTYTVNGDTVTITGYYNASPLPELISVIPSVIEGKPVTSIGDSAFYNPSPMSGYMLADSITIPDSVTNIGYRAFGNNMNLWNVFIGDGVVSIGDYAFSQCPLTNAVLGRSVRLIGNYAFYWSGLPDITLPDSVVSIGSYAFYQCNVLTNIVMGTNLANIGNSAFRWCSSLTDLTISPSVTNIGSSAFSDCSMLGHVTFIPDSPSSIGNLAFAYSSLTNATFGAHVTSIGDSVFRNCFSLIDIYFCGNAPEKGSTIFLEAAPVTIYYKTNTAGWLATFGGMPTAAWDPQIQTGNTDFGVRSNRFGFTVTGSTNFAVRIEACTNLSQGTWTPVGTAALNSGTLSFSDPAFTNYPSRYYRVSMPQ